MGLFERLKEGLRKTHDRLTHEIKRIVSGSPRLSGASAEDLEAALIGADLGLATTTQIVTAVKRAYESQGRAGRVDVFGIARAELERCFAEPGPELARAPDGLTVVSIVGVNGTGKTTTSAKLARWCADRGHKPALAACDTFRAAAIEQLKIWGDRLQVPVIAGAYGADPAAVAHDAVSVATARGLDYLFVDTAGRLHTKHNLMQELQKVHRVIGKKLAGAPHDVLLVVDATTGMNALAQAREFHKAVQLTGLIVTKLDGTSKAGMVVSIHRELRLPVRFIGVGEQAEDLQPFVAREFAEAMFSAG